MKPYRTLATVRLFAGIIGLTDKQAKKRLRYLSKIKDNVYEVIREVVFKAGETIGLEDTPKPYRKVLEPMEPEKPEAPAIELEIKETVDVEAKPVAKKRKYTKRSRA